MPTRRRDGEYRLHEYDSETVHRLAVELLQVFAKDPGAAQIADLDVYLPDIRDLARSDQERDDLADAIYEACGRASITIPDDSGSTTERLVAVIHALAGEYGRLAGVLAPHLSGDARAELREHVGRVVSEIPKAIKDATATPKGARP